MFKTEFQENTIHFHKSLQISLRKAVAFSFFLCPTFFSFCSPNATNEFWVFIFPFSLFRPIDFEYFLSLEALKNSQNPLGELETNFKMY